MSTNENTDTRTTDEIRADIERTRGELGGDVTALTEKVSPRTRVRELVTTVSSKAASAVPPKARQAGQKVGEHRTPAAIGTLAVAAAGTALVLQRRRAAKARAARRGRLSGFFSR